MCGRYVLVATIEQLEQHYRLNTISVPELWNGSYNIGPGKEVPVICSDRPDTLQMATFGMSPAWAQKRMFLFNARAEGDGNPNNDPEYAGGPGIIQKPAFRKPIRSQRCLIPANAFIEGPENEKLQKPYLIYQKGEALLSLAGVYEDWTDPETAVVYRGFAIITTVANELLQSIGHRRSPVILNRSRERKWLLSEDLHEITALLHPFDSHYLNAFPISSEIRNPRADGRDLITPLGHDLNPGTVHKVSHHIRTEGMGGQRGKV